MLCAWDGRAERTVEQVVREVKRGGGSHDMQAHSIASPIGKATCTIGCAGCTLHSSGEIRGWDSSQRGFADASIYPHPSYLRQSSGIILSRGKHGNHN